jgi:hypothetical protein
MMQSQFGEGRWQDPVLARWAGLVVVLAAAVLYLLTLDTGLRPDELQGGDLITHQYAQVEARPSNAPGYPLYTMGGWLWFRMGRALFSWALNPVQVLSSYSALWGLAALLTLYVILLQVTARNWILASLLTAFYGTTYFFWFYSVSTEQYTSAIWQILMVIWLAFRWDEEPDERSVLWLAFLVGTMLANMLTTLFIVPPLLWFILSRRPAYPGRPGLILKSIVASFLPVLSYAYVYVRGAQHPEWRGAGQWPSAWQWFLSFVSTQQGRDELAPGLALGNFFTPEFPSLIWQELTWLVLAGGLAGLALLGRRRAGFLYGTLAIYALFSWGYRFGNWFQVILPAYPIVVIGFAALLNAVWPRRRLPGLSPPHWIRGGTVALLLALVGYRLVVSLPLADQRFRPEDTALDPGWTVLADQPKTPAVVVADYEERLALQYLATVWQATDDLYPIGPGDTPPAGLAEDPQITLYLTRRAAAAAQSVTTEASHAQAAGQELAELSSEPRLDLPPGVQRLDLALGSGLKLLGIELISDEASLPRLAAARLHRPNWQIALYWTTQAELELDLTISVRPLVEGKQIGSEREPLIQDHQPVWGLYPTSHWRAGEVVRDVYGLRLPPDLKPAEVMAVQIVLYHSVIDRIENFAEVTVQLQSAQIR